MGAYNASNWVTATPTTLDHAPTVNETGAVPMTWHGGKVSFGITGCPTFNATTDIPAGGSLTCGVLQTSTAAFGVFVGSGAPTLAAAKGSLYLRSDGSSTSTRAYIATDSAGTWTAITTAG